MLATHLLLRFLATLLRTAPPALVLVLVTLAGQAEAGPPLEPRGQQLRFDGAQLDDQGVCVDLQVRDLCLTEAKKRTVVVPCSEWRALPPVDPPRRPSFAGKVELPDGQVARVPSRKGEDQAGGEHTLTARSASPEAPNHWPVWQADHDSGGRWCLDASLLGAALASGSGEGAPGWSIDLYGWVDGEPVTWTDVEDQEVVTPAQVAGLDTWVLELTAAQVEENEPAWHCAALAAWYRDGTLLRRSTWADADSRLPLSELAGTIAMAQPVCPGIAGDARDQVCDLGDDLATDISSAEEAGQFLRKAERAQPLVAACPEDTLQPMLDASAAAFARFAVGGEWPAPGEVRGRLAGWLGESWEPRAQEFLAEEVARSFDLAVGAGDLDAIARLLHEYGETLGEAWSTGAGEQLHALVRTRFDDALADERTTEASALLDSHAPSMDATWADGARARLAELEAVLADAPPLIAYLQPSGNQCVFRIERPGEPRRTVTEVTLDGACTGNYILTHHPDGTEVVVTYGQRMHLVEIRTQTAEALPTLPVQAPPRAVSLDSDGRLLVQAQIASLEPGKGGCRWDRTCRFDVDGGKYTFEASNYTPGASLFRAWRLEGDAWSVYGTQVLEWAVGLPFERMEMSIPDLAPQLKPRTQERIDGCLGADAGPDVGCEEVGELPGVTLEQGYDGPSWLVGGGSYLLGVGTYWYEGTVISGPLVWKIRSGWKKVPGMDGTWTGFAQNGRYLLTCLPDGNRPPARDEIRVYDLATHQPTWSDQGWCPSWWEPPTELEEP